MDSKALKRFAAKYVERDMGYRSPCWVWTAAKTANGYARMRVDGAAQLAHRVSYEHHVGPIPDGLDIDHLCRVRHCVNPAHMEPVTRGENIARGLVPSLVRARAAAVTHCPLGHEYTPENTVIDPGGSRLCRTCQNENSRAQRLKRAGLPLDTGPRGNATKTHCRAGHAFDDANTYVSNGKRLCRACRREAVRRYDARRASVVDPR